MNPVGMGNITQRVPGFFIQDVHLGAMAHIDFIECHCDLIPTAGTDNLKRLNQLKTAIDLANRRKAQYGKKKNDCGNKR